MKKFDAYIICTSPRSGSTLLCRMLQEISGAGFPDSHFHQPSLEHWFETYGLEAAEFTNPKVALKAVFDAAYRVGRADAEIFGLRMQRGSFGFFAEQLKVLYPSFKTDKTRIEAAFGSTLFIYLTRLDKVAQAVSVVKAQQTGLWHKAPDGTEIERIKAAGHLVYDPEAIAVEFKEFAAADTDWKSWFEAENIQPLHLTYEALAADPRGTLARVVQCLGLDPNSVADQEPPVAKLSDAVNLDWADRFRSQVLPILNARDGE